MAIHSTFLCYFSVLLAVLSRQGSRATLSTARVWNEEILAAIRMDVPNPPVHARNLFHLATAMYDAWAAYDTTAVGYIYHERILAPDHVAARKMAVSYAAYRVLKSRYANSVSALQINAALDLRMTALGYDAAVVATVGPSPAHLGNRIALKILAWGFTDGAGQANSYRDSTYTNTQPVFEVLENGVPLGGYPAGADPDIWHPLTFDEGFTQNGIGPIFLQPFVGATWLSTRPFSLPRNSPTEPWFDPGPPARLRSGDPLGYRNEALEVLLKSKQLGDNTLVDISPGAAGNNPLGLETGTGRPVNSVTGQAYTANLVPLGDFARVLAVYWADGPASETPPGHWHVLANEVSEELAIKRLGGVGPTMDDLEWDVKLYFALAGATHDAACAAWSLKRKYNSPRPLSMIRFMARQGQCTHPALPSYHAEGLPLVPGLVAVATAASLAPGGEHAGRGFALGDILVFTWPGRPEDPTVQRALPRWILGVDWFPFQDRTFVSPAFPGYVSGHSTFSRAAAEVLTAMTGSSLFPGGLATFTAPAGSFLKVEVGPSVPVQLQWASYFDAADQAGASRRWGGIHPKMDDLPGRTIGSQCGLQAWALAQRYWDGSILQAPTAPVLHHHTNLGIAELRWNSVPGLFYQIQQSADLISWEPAVPASQATEPTSTWTDTLATRKFYQIIPSASAQP